jgi:hypothetical protein
MRESSRWIAWVALPTLSWSVSVYAQPLPPDVVALKRAVEIDIGSFCLSDIPPAARVVEVGQSHLQPDGSLWWDINIKVNSSSQRKPVAYFYSKLRQPSTGEGITKCSDTANLAFLKGRLNAATISAYYRPGTHVPPPALSESPRWQIDPGKLFVEFGAAEAQVGPLFGASVVATDAKPSATTLTNRILDVTNPTSTVLFDLTANRQTGILQISTTDVVLSKTKLVLGSKPMTVDLACRYLGGLNQGKVTFSRDVSTGEAGFVSGECRKSEVDLPPDEWNEANLKTTVSSAHVQTMSLIGHPTHPELRLSTLSLATQNLTYGADRVTITPSSPIVVESLAGPVALSPEQLHLESGKWTGIATSGAAVRMGSAFPLTGTGEVKISSLSDEHVDGSFNLRPATLPALGAVVPTSITAFSIKFVGEPKSPYISGSLEASMIQLAALGLREKLGPLQFHSDPGISDALAFAVDLDLSAPEGQFTLGDPDGKNVRVKGQLKRLHVKGNLRLNPPSGEPSLAVLAGGLVLDGTVAASVSPLVLGSPVEFVGGSVSLSCPGGLTLSKSHASGAISLEAKALVLATPSLAFANPDQGFLVQAPMRTEGAATIQFDIGSGKARLHNARIVAANLEAKSLDAASPVSISGIRLVSPDLTLGNLVVSIAEGTGLVQGKDLRLATDEITHDGPPFWNVKLGPGKQLYVPQLDAHLGDTDKDLQIVDVSMEGLSLDGLSAEFRSADGFAVKGTTFHISADSLSEKVITNGSVSIASGDFGVATQNAGAAQLSTKAAFDKFTLSSLNGSKDKLAGTGAIHLHDISVDGKFKLPLKDKCADGWKLTGAFDIAEVAIGLTMNSGKVSGSANVTQGKAYVVNDGESNCSWNEDYTLVEEQWADVNPCGIWGGSCHIKTIVVPAIKGQINWEADLIKLDASATITEAAISVGGGGSAHLCIRQLNLSPPVIIATYTPSIQKGNFVADFVHDLIRTIAAGIEGSVASLIGTQASLASYLSAVLGIICVQ